ncbi:MAG: C4-type zinc ribbon domain-containing protein [Elusimicrobiota bacterium]
MSEKLEGLNDLQQEDVLIDKLNLSKGKIPEQISALDEQLIQTKKNIEEIKKEFSRKVLEKKSKEMEVLTKDEQIRKHQAELSVIKSNEAYRALLSEIEKSKKEKDSAEEVILFLMEELDEITAKLKAEEQRLKEEQANVAEKKSRLENDLQRLTADFSVEEEKRKILAGKISATLLARYEMIRKSKGKGGIALAVVEGEVCGGCRRSLPHNLINEARKGKDLVYCENCSRILYWVAAEQTK